MTKTIEERRWSLIFREISGIATEEEKEELRKIDEPRNEPANKKPVIGSKNEIRDLLYPQQR